jgi:hypothetical protein
MCGIFGVVTDSGVNGADLSFIARHCMQRGRDSSGLIWFKDDKYRVSRADYEITRLLKQTDWSDSNVVMGHSRLITNGLNDNQPVVRDGFFVIHNGIIVNEDQVWNSIGVERRFQVDSEAIIGVALAHMRDGGGLKQLSDKIISTCNGTISAILGFPEIGKGLLISNNGSLYVGWKGRGMYFASESYPLRAIGCTDVDQILNGGYIIDLPRAKDIEVSDFNIKRRVNLIPSVKLTKQEESMLEYREPELKRCTRCILPETMPFISFDSDGVCNYCRNYKPRNNPKPKEELFKLVEPYRRANGPDCIVPLSGGRDSCYSLHLVVNELGMRPIAYTYDWGMVTDLARRNISRICSKLGVENIIIAADIAKKRENIKKNLIAWLKSPHLGMVSILTAGDKHFFRYIEVVKKQTGIDLNLWGVNPLEVTHFKAGFLGIKPDFENKRVYMSGPLRQLNYQYRRFLAMLKSPGFFNSSLWDTISGEYYRSFKRKTDYFHIFDYWRWDEQVIDRTLKEYDWELAPDTRTTWRIGDGTAAFYNYIYYTVAGFTEHDTFRSNQIREGQITREEALSLVKEENRPRYQNIRWYLDAVGLDFKYVIPIINSIPKLYQHKL